MLRKSIGDNLLPKDWTLEKGLALIKKCDRELNLGLEVAVKTRLGAAGLSEDGIDADLADTVP